MIWTDEYMVEVSLLDQQHKKLFGLIGQLRRHLSGRTKDGDLEEIVTALCQYTEAHFLSEERLMLQSGYPYYEYHKLAHDSMAGRVQRYRREVLDGNRMVAEELHAYLSAWWNNHVLETDKRYCTHFASEGIR